MSSRIFAALCCLLCSFAASAADDTDPSLVIDKYFQHFVVATDGSYLLTVDHAKTIVLQRAVQDHSQYYISYNRMLDALETVEAYTRKRDGRRVPVAPEQIKDQQEAASSDAPMFQDTRLKIIVFPDIEAGDQLVVHYVLRRHTALFPGHFEDLSFSPFYANPQFQLIYDMPDSMPLYADAAGFAPVAAGSAPGRKRYQWHYIDGPNPRAEEASVSYLDYGRRLAVSTFAGYPAFAQAYAARSAGQARVTPAIAQLAQQITGGLLEPRAKALALSDWVRTHIRYVGVYIGPGGVVPHPAATVLANRYGDCKDHAVLLEALLGAAGIASSAALVNSGTAFRLPRTPTLGVFNHVITYVPALELFLDSTAESIAAGYLPSGVMGKPALLVKSGALAHTPSYQLERNRTFAWFHVHEDGRSSFSVAKISEGAIAEPYRQAVRDTKEADRNLFAEQLLQGLGQRGEGVFESGKLDGTGDEYSMRLHGSSDHFASLPGPVGLATSFNIWGGLAETVAAFGQERRRSQDFVCPAIDIEDETGFSFPKGVKIIAVPKPVALRDANLDYSARYTRHGNIVIAQRRLAFRHAGMVCTAADYQRMQPLLDRMLRDLKSQVIVGG
jgi:transglutaminase-like putative cysteine protease